MPTYIQRTASPIRKLKAQALYIAAVAALAGLNAALAALGLPSIESLDLDSLQLWLAAAAPMIVQWLIAYFTNPSADDAPVPAT